MCNSSKKTEFEVSRKFVEKSKIGNLVNVLFKYKLSNENNLKSVNFVIQ